MRAPSPVLACPAVAFSPGGDDDGRLPKLPLACFSFVMLAVRATRAPWRRMMVATGQRAFFARIREVTATGGDVIRRVANCDVANRISRSAYWRGAG